MTITLTPTLRRMLSLTMIALAITSTGLAALLAAGAFTTYTATLGAGVAMGALLGSNLTLVSISITERRTHRQQHEQRHSPNASA